MARKSKPSQINRIPPFWEKGHFRLFISHLASNKADAQKLKVNLEKYAITSFVAHEDIEPTKEWQNEIELAIRTCNAFVALMEPGFHESNWTDQEIGIAIGRDKLIIPVRLGQDPYGFIGKYQAINVTAIPLIIDEIFKSLLKNEKTSKKIAKSLIFKFENSNSFAEAKENMSLIREIVYWDEDLLERLKSAPKNNSQIRNAIGVPGKINWLIDRIQLDK